MLFDRLQVPQDKDAGGDALLVVGAGGDVGSVLVQLARQLTGLTVAGTASREQTRQWVRQRGAHHVIDHPGSLPQQLRDAGVGQVRYWPASRTVTCLRRRWPKRWRRRAGWA